MTTQAEAHAANAALLYNDLRRDIEGLISVHGVTSPQVTQFIHNAPLSEQSPFRIDTIRYALALEERRLGRKVQSEAEDIHRVAGDRRNYGRGLPTWGLTIEEAFAKAKKISVEDSTYVGRQAFEAVKDYRAAVDALRLAKEVSTPLNLEFQRRPWTRAFLVTDGHVHSSTACSTCFITTEFTWLPILSGRDEAGIVKMAGERACTVCYPTAPTLRDFEKASPLFTEEEAERNRQREIRAQEKDARQAKRIAAGLTHDGSEFVVTYVEPNARTSRYNPETRQHEYFVADVTRTERFKTEKAAIMWVVAGMASTYKRDFEIPARQAVIEAVATKHGKTVEQVGQEIDAKVQAKIKRDSRGY